MMETHSSLDFVFSPEDEQSIPCVSKKLYTFEMAAE